VLAFQVASRRRTCMLQDGVAGKKRN